MTDPKDQLHLAILYKRVDKVRDILIQYGDEVEMNSGFYTHLHFACIMQRKDVVELLLQHGADVNAKSIYGKKPIEYAIKPDIIELLKQRSSSNN